MKLQALVWVVSAVVLACCQRGGGGPARPKESQADLFAMARAQSLGAAIYRSDTASATATDVGFAHGIDKDARIRGWVTRSDGDGFLVQFVDEAGLALYDLRLASPTDREPRFEALDPPRPLDAESEAMRRAQATAVAGFEPLCQRLHNVVVLPGRLDGVDGWLVYFLPATTDAAELILAGHVLIVVSADGGDIVERRPLSRSCLTGQAPADVKVEGLSVTELDAPTPRESHVFLSLLYRRPLIVTTGARRWWVDDGFVLLMDGEEPVNRPE